MSDKNKRSVTNRHRLQSLRKIGAAGEEQKRLVDGLERRFDECKTEWQTSLFPKDDRYIVPIKASVRKTEGLEEGDHLTVQLEVRG